MSILDEVKQRLVSGNTHDAVPKKHFTFEFDLNHPPTPFTFKKMALNMGGGVSKAFAKKN